jgi:hypothetical protein
VKNLKGKFTPKYIQLRNKEGRLVRLEKRADAIADYLEQEHWQNPVEEGGTRTINQRKLQTLLNKEIQKAPFTWEELHSCIKLTKKNKEPGPDNTRMELIIWLDGEKSRKLLDTINDWWEEKEGTPSPFTFGTERHLKGIWKAFPRHLKEFKGIFPIVADAKVL